MTNNDRERAETEFNEAYEKAREEACNEFDKRAAELERDNDNE